MDNKFYLTLQASWLKIGRQPLRVLGAALALCACSSQGSSFGAAGAGAMLGGSGTGDGGGGSALGGAETGNAGTGIGPAGGASSTTGGDVGAGGLITAGGATQSGGGAPNGGNANGGSSTGGAAQAAGAGGAAMMETCPKPAGQICHEFVANDNSRNEVHYVNEFNPSKNWTVKIGDTGQNSPRGIQIVDNAAAKSGKAALISIEHGFSELDLVGGAALSKVSLFGSVTSAVRIPNDGSPTKFAGATVLARDLNPPELDFVDAAGKTLTPAVKLPFASAGTELRKLERNPTNGNFSLTKYESSTTAYIYEVTEQGALVNKFRLPAGGKGYNAVWLAGGGMMATTGSLATVVTLSATGAVVGSPLGGPGNLKDSSGAAVYTDFFSGFFRLPNGNVVVANWLGHVDPSTHPTTPELLEISPSNQLVWTWGNQSIATFITYGYIIR